MSQFFRLAWLVVCPVLLGPASAQAEPEHPPPQIGDDNTDRAVEASFAQEGRADHISDRPPAKQSRMIEEIIVTTQKREQNLFEVPQAVTAFSSEKLEAMGVQTVQDLQKVTPGLTISNVVGFNVVFLRGVGADAFLPGADSSVPFYLDGIPLLATQGSVDTLGRVERIEVLKGPQGTLFGTNSVGGAINVITPEPSQAFSGDASLTLGNFNQRAAQSLVNLPLTQNLAVTVSGFYSAQDNTYTNDNPNGFPAMDVYAKGARIKALWNITERIDNTFYASLQQASGNGGLNFENTIVWPAFRAILPQDPKADRHDSMDSRAGSQITSKLLANTLAWNTNIVDAKFIVSWQRLSANAFADFDASATPLANADTPVQLGKQNTYELQFSSNEGTPWSDRVTWVGGLFYIYSSGGFNPVRFNFGPNAVNAIAGSGLGDFVNDVINPITAPLGVDLAQGISVNTSGVLSGWTIAEYFQGTFKLSDKLNLILGQRYQHTERDLTNSKTSVPNPLVPGGEIVALKADVPTLYADQFMPRVGLQWFFIDEAQLYASWARGYKSPTYNTLNLTSDLLGPIPEVKPTRADAYEIGVKSQLLDNSLQLNAAGFYTKQKDLLVGFISILTGGVVTYDNAPAARIYGGELEIVWQPMPELNSGLVVAASGTYLDAKYTDYPNGRGYDTVTGLPFGEGFLLPPAPPRDFSGNRMVRTPEWSYTANISQTIPIGDDSLELSADVAYSSGFYFLPQSEREYEQKAHYLLNAHATYMHTASNLQITLWGRNLTNTNFVESNFTSEFGRNEMLNDPRTYGATVKWSF